MSRVSATFFCVSLIDIDENFWAIDTDEDSERTLQLFGFYCNSEDELKEWSGSS